MSTSTAEHRCEEAACALTPLLGARHCWAHLPDRDAWRHQQEQAVAPGEDMSRLRVPSARISPESISPA